MRYWEQPNHFGVLHCVQRNGLWSTGKQSDNYREIITAPWLTFTWGLYIKQNVYLFARFEESINIILILIIIIILILINKLKHLMERLQNKLLGTIHQLNWWFFHAVSDLLLPSNNHKSRTIVGKKLRAFKKSGSPFSFWRMYFSINSVFPPFYHFLIYNVLL